jgi:hypothetical protein
MTQYKARALAKTALTIHFPWNMGIFGRLIHCQRLKDLILRMSFKLWGPLYMQDTGLHYLVSKIA